MSMSRAAALTYLQNKYASLATLTGQLTTDTADGYGPAIDDSLLMMDVAYTDLATGSVVDEDVPAYRALLRYNALLHFEQMLAAKVDFDVSGSSASVQKKQSAQLTQVRQMLAEAAAQASALGYSVAVGASAPATLKSIRFNPDVPYRTDGLIP